MFFSIISFVFLYTDTLIDFLAAFALMISGAMLYSLANYFFINKFKYYEVIFIVCHLIGILFIQSSRPFLLIENPFYFSHSLLLLSLITAIKKSNDFIRTGVIIALLVVLRAAFPLTYIGDFKMGYDTPVTPYISKPVRLAISAYKEDHPKKILSQLTSINYPDRVVIFISDDYGRKAYRYIYKDNEIQKD